MVRRARRSQTEHTHGRPAERRSRPSLTVMKRPMLWLLGWVGFNNPPRLPCGEQVLGWE